MLHSRFIQNPFGNLQAFSHLHSLTDKLQLHFIILEQKSNDVITTFYLFLRYIPGSQQFISSVAFVIFYVQNKERPIIFSKLLSIAKLFIVK